MYLLYATNIHQGYRPRCEKADSRQHGEEQVQDRGKKKNKRGKKMSCLLELYLEPCSAA